MAKKAKTVGQLLAALLKSAPGETLEITWDEVEGRYFVDFGGDSTYGPKMYGSFKRLGTRKVEAQDAVIARLRGRVGA